MIIATESTPILIVPLGGLGEIGMNCLCIEAGRKILVIDCGIGFPNSDLGIDIYHPNFSYLEEHRDRVVGIVLTHGHEDHIGGLPYLLRHVSAPVFGTRYTLAIARERLAERDIEHRQATLNTITAGRTFNVGPFSIEPIHVTHSIPDACALAIRVGNASIVHTGDFKLDADPPCGLPTDEARLRSLGDEGVDLLLSDSTNINVDGSSASERVVGKTLECAIARCDTRVIVGMFSSNVHRLRMVGDIAVKLGRKVSLFGRSVQTHVRAAMQEDLLGWPSDLIVSQEMIGALERRHSIIVAGGTQGEPNAALSRLVSGGKTPIAIAPGDLLLLSSRVIPGNDLAVQNMISSYLRQRVDVESYSTNLNIHASGHAHRDELRHMISLLRPKAFMPVHGTLLHLNRHAELASSEGISDIVVAENGDVIEYGVDGLRKCGTVPVGKIASWYGEEIPPSVLGRREQIARHGVAIVVLSADNRGSLTKPPSMRFYGVFDNEVECDACNSVVLSVEACLARTLARRQYIVECPTDQQIADVAERAVQRAVEEVSNQRPVTIVQVIRT